MLNAKKYFSSLFFLLLALTLPAILIMRENYFNWFLSIPCFFVLLGIIFYFSINKLAKYASEPKFMSLYLVVLFSRLLISIAGVTLYLTLVKEQKTIFIIGFFIYYIAFSVFETNMFLQINKKKQP